MPSLRPCIPFALPLCLLLALPAFAAYDPALEMPALAQWDNEIEALGRAALMDDWPTAGGAHGGLLLYSWYVFRLDVDYAPLFLRQYGQGSPEAARLAHSLALASATCAAEYWPGLAELTTGAIGLGTELVTWLGETAAGPDEIQAQAEELIASLLSADQQAARAAQRIRAAESIEGLADWQDDLPAEPAADGAETELHSVVFHVPLNFNDGTPVPQELSEKLEKLVCEQAGGFTVSLAEGAWEYEGQVYREPMRRFLVGLPEEKVQPFVDAIEALLKGDFAQIAVWVEVDGEPQIL